MGPLSDLAHGWIHLPEGWTDVWHGALHDADSGAYLEYTIGPAARRRALALARPTDETEKREVGSWSVRVRSGQNARERYEALYADGLRAGPELAERMRRLLPGAEARVLLVTFGTDILFEAALYDQEQERRCRDLLLVAPRFLTEGDVVPPDMLDLSPQQYEAVQPGASITAVLAAFGAPKLVRREGRAAFVLEYTVRAPGTWGSAYLTFGQDQRLGRKLLNP